MRRIEALTNLKVDEYLLKKNKDEYEKLKNINLGWIFLDEFIYYLEIIVSPRSVPSSNDSGVLKHILSLFLQHL